MSKFLQELKDVFRKSNACARTESLSSINPLSANPAK